MEQNYSKHFLVLLFIFSATFFYRLDAQSFTQSNLNFNGNGSISNGTSLMYGPDGRLYVAEYSGKIKIFSVQRISKGNYEVTASETLLDIQEIQDHNDDGSLFSNVNREMTGLTVTGTITNPIIYVTSSDFRIGGGGGGTSDRDKNLDTNSGIITRFTWNGATWDVVDIVRGLPRSEENHATNGLEFVTVKGINYLIVTQGGHTNAGAPSNNFARTVEYALSAALLSVDLDQINALPILNDNGRKYVYDIPTLDDPTRTNVNGITDPDNPAYDGVDLNDPFGGNDGLNQGIVVAGGPVQIFSPGYRNTYDLVVTESGAVYATDNGANGGWGGFPENEGGGLATNDYNPSEPGSSSTVNGEKVNNVDHLSLITNNIQNYTFGSFYGGHPNPTRANPSGAGLYTRNGNAAVFRTQTYDPDGSTPGSTTNPNNALPANWPPVPLAQANAVEGDWRGPGIDNPDGPNDAVVALWGTNTNGIDEYTASNFNGAMKGDLIAGKNGGVLRRVELNSDGGLETLTDSFASGLGGNALGVTCNSDSDLFAGTIWVASFNNNIVVLEPEDAVICILPGQAGYDETADYDADGYTNKDEVDNDTDPCNGGSQPNDFDKSAGAPLISDLNDTDDDNDNILDQDDAIQLGNVNAGSDGFLLPVTNELFSDTSLGGYLGLGLTGLMNNGDANPNWLNWLDRRDNASDPNPNDILGGAIGAMTMQMTSGTAIGSTNNQEKAFQYAVQVNKNSGIFTVSGSMVNFSAPLQLYGNAAAPNGELGFFIGDGTQSNYIKFVINQSGLSTVQELDDVVQIPVSVEIPQGKRPSSETSFYFVINAATGSVSLEYALDGLNRTVLGITQAQGAILEAITQPDKDLVVGLIGTSNAIGVELEGTWDFLNVAKNGLPPARNEVLYRVNSGGPEITAIDGEIVWGEDTVANNSTFLSESGTNNASTFGITGFTSAVNQSTTPASIYDTERFDRIAGTPNMAYSFPVSEIGNYEVRLYFANGWSGTANSGERIFNVQVEGSTIPELTSIDLSGTYGNKIGAVVSYVLSVNDGSIDVELIHGSIQNPLINGIEILRTNTTNEIPIVVETFENQTNFVGDILDGSLVIVATGGEGNLVYSASGLPPGVTIEPTNGQIGGTIDLNANTTTPYAITITVDDADASNTDAKTVNFSWAIQSTPNTSELEFTIVDAFNDGDFTRLIDGQEITLEDITGKFLNIRADVENIVGSVDFSITGPIVTSATDNVQPYSIFGDEAGSYSGRLFSVGSYALTASVYSAANATGSLIETVRIGFSIVDSASSNTPPKAIAIADNLSGTLPLRVGFSASTSDDDTGIISYLWDFGDGTSSTDINPQKTYSTSGTFTVVLTVEDTEGAKDSDTLQITVGSNSTNGVLGFTIIDAFDDGEFLELIDGQTIDLADINGKFLNIRANTNPSVTGSVEFTVSGPFDQTVSDNIQPYALFGDIGGSYSGVLFSTGVYTISATTYSKANKGGTQGATKTIQFSVIDATGLTSKLVFEGINNFSRDGYLGVLAFPNPAEDELFIANLDAKIGIEAVNIFTTTGRLIEHFNTRKHMTFEDGLYLFNVSRLTSGIYYIDILTDSGKRINIRFMKK